MRAAVADPELFRAAEALVAGRPAEADALLRAVLARRPDDPSALWMAGDVASRCGRQGEAAQRLARCVELAPQFTAARYAYAMVLTWLDRVQEALAQADRLLADQPANALYRHLRASSLLRLGEEAAAAEAYAAVLDAHPDQALSWMSYGHVLKTLGRQAEAVDAYRRCLALDAGQGEAWWSLANLKTVRFTEADVTAMRMALDADLAGRRAAAGALRPGQGPGGRRPIRRGLRPLRPGQRPPARAAGLRCGRDDRADATRQGAAGPELFLRAGRAGRARAGPDLHRRPAAFGLHPRRADPRQPQRGGGHPGTALHPCARGPARRSCPSGGGGRLSRRAGGALPQELSELGREYLAHARAHRKLDRPLFIDKLPNNFAHIGLIHLILPNAKIIDARRHPLGCCLSGFKQHFAVGQPFTYDLTDIGRYYADYVELMAHFDAVLPGRVHRVIYERMVADPEGETRALLDHCGLAFEPACLKFYENRRAVRTASSEQVRQPIFPDAAGHWRHFEPWLEPLKAALGPALPGDPGPSSI